MSFLASFEQSKLRIKTKVAAEIVNNSTTLVDDPDLFIDLKANKRYAGMILGIAFSSTAADMKITFKVISGTVYAFYHFNMENGNVAAFGTAATKQTSNANETLLIPFWVRTGSGGGTLQFQFAQAVAEVSNTQLLQGSMLIIFEE